MGASGNLFPLFLPMYLGQDLIFIFLGGGSQQVFRIAIKGKNFDWHHFQNKFHLVPPSVSNSAAIDFYSIKNYFMLFTTRTKIWIVVVY